MPKTRSTTASTRPQAPFRGSARPCRRESYGSGTAVDANLRGLRAPGAGQAWHRMGDNYYLVDLASGRYRDAVYNLHD